jgi:hypothetical protein
MQISLFLISLLAQVAVHSAKKYPARYRHLLETIQQGDSSSNSAVLQQQPNLRFGSGKEECDDVREVLIRGADICNETYSLFLYANGVDPAPGDRELFNLPLLDPVPFEEDGTVKIIGWLLEDDAYVPLADKPELDCMGHSAWTFDTDAETGVINQVSDQYSCEAFSPVGTGRTGIAGGTGKYACAEGVIEKTRVGDPVAFAACTGGFVIWKIVNCGRCDQKGLE